MMLGEGFGLSSMGALDKIAEESRKAQERIQSEIGHLAIYPRKQKPSMRHLQETAPKSISLPDTKNQGGNNE